MAPQTTSYYDANAAAVAERYEHAEMAGLHQLLLPRLPSGSRVLEVGCGSGREAAFLLANGYDVTALDASTPMIETALRHHPELQGRLRQASLPLDEDNGLLTNPCDGVVCIAVLMHIPERDLFGAAFQLKRLLKKGGKLVLSTSFGREGLDGNRDAAGRLFAERPPEKIRLLFERLGFRLVAERRSGRDAFARQIQWTTQVFSLETGGEVVRPVDQLETISSSEGWRGGLDDRVAGGNGRSCRRGDGIRHPCW